MKVAEYTQVDTELKKHIIHHSAVYDEDENGRYGVISEAWDEEVTEEVPVMGMVYRDATAEEMAEMQKEELAHLNEYHPLTVEEKTKLLAEQITEELPEGTIMGRSVDAPITLPFKVGYRWERKLVGMTVVYESVRDENAIGTQNNPIIYTEECPLIDNAWYKFGDTLKVYMMGEFEEM